MAAPVCALLRHFTPTPLIFIFCQHAPMGEYRQWADKTSQFLENKQVEEILIYWRRQEKVVDCTYTIVLVLLTAKEVL